MDGALLTTLCYLERDGAYLMLHRVKKKNDLNQDKWVGIGGKFEGVETPEECLLREAKEETGLTLTSYRLRGIVTFLSDRWQAEYMFLYTADAWEGSAKDSFERTFQTTYKKNLTEIKTSLQNYAKAMEEYANENDDVTSRGARRFDSIMG